MSEKILVTGSTGKVGAHVVDQLAAAGVQVTAAVQATSKVEGIKKAGGVPVVMDLNSNDSIRAALGGMDRVFLLMPMVQNQVELVAKVVDEAKKAHIKQIVKLSVMGADRIPGIKLGRENAEMEKYIIASGLPYTFLRPTFFMQNFLGEKTIKTQNAFYDSAGDGKASHIDTRDIAAVAVTALTTRGHEGKAYELTGSQLLSNSDIAEILSSLTGRKVAYVNVSDDDVRNGMKGAGFPEWLIEQLVELSIEHRVGNYAKISPSVEEVTGRKPRTLEQFFREYIEAFR